MFGYVRVFAPGLRVSEYEAYKSAYCGFCKRLGKDYGQLWRLTLSYDFAFIKLLSESLRQDKLTACRERCVIHPFRKRYCMASRDTDKMLSAGAVLLMNAKIQDNLADSKWYVKWVWKTVSLLTRFSVRRAAFDFPLLKEETDQLTRRQKKAEENENASRDSVADPTGQLMASFFELLSEDPVQKRVLHEFGYQIGRYVYFTDALDDLKDDAKKKNFNPFLLGFSEVPEDAVLQEIKSEGLQTVNRCIGGAIEAYELLDIYHMKPILDNVLYFGLQQTAKNVVAGKKQSPENEMEIY